jgi:hypothetical protein
MVACRCAGMQILLIFVLATLWWQTGDDYSQANAVNIAGILFFWVSLPSFGCVCQSVAKVPLHRKGAAAIIWVRPPIVSSCWLCLQRCECACVVDATCFRQSRAANIGILLLNFQAS